jgi:hypothetical protein
MIGVSFGWGAPDYEHWGARMQVERDLRPRLPNGGLQDLYRLRSYELAKLATKHGVDASVLQPYAAEQLRNERRMT